MVGIVVVSHSRQLAEGLVALVRQMTGDTVALAAAAGAGDEGADLGTDAGRILEALQEVAGPDGTLVLVDLGSALLSAETALDFLADDERARVRICPAPLVEGAMAAAVQASLGSDLDAVCREAVAALRPKQEHLGEAEPATVAAGRPEAPPGAAGGASEARATLRNQHGLHARPAARFVRLAASFDAEVSVRNLSSGRGPVSAKSISEVATLGALAGHALQINATGREADAATAALAQLVDEGFGEAPAAAAAAAVAAAAAPPAPTAPAAPTPAVDAGGVLRGVPVCEGYAAGPAFRFHRLPPDVPATPSEDPDQDWQRLEAALEASRREMEEERAGLHQSLGAASAGIIDAQLLMLADPVVLERVRQRLFAERHHVARAWLDAIREVADSYRGLSDAYLRERAADVVDAGNRVALHLLGASSAAPQMPDEPAVLLATELAPTDVPRLDPARVVGVACEAGSTTSHSAILLRGLGIPAIFGLGPALQDVAPGTPLGMDAGTGRLWIDADTRVTTRLETQRRSWLQRRARLLRQADEPAITHDGTRIEVAANVGDLADAAAAAEHGAAGVGLLRTEFLFAHSAAAPSEEEQLTALTEVSQLLHGQPVIVRTLDVGGDKPLPYLPQPAEANPFLGVRGIRLQLRHPELLDTQLRAVLRTAATHPLRVMFPMIATLEEVEEVMARMEAVHRRLEAAGVPSGWPIETGIMVETPAAALLAPAFAAVLDFFSIGTNDLTQYTLAADRGSAQLAGLSDALHPAVMRLIGEVAAAANAAGKWAGVCGELAADALAVPLLVGLGVTELSVRPVAVPMVKALVRAIRRDKARALAEAALQQARASDVRALSTRFLQRHAPQFAPQPPAEE